MKKILELMTENVAKVFEECGYDPSYAKVALSNRPDLCEYQCNGALAAAKVYKKAPIMIANEVADKLKLGGQFEEVAAVMPGFINLKLGKEYLAQYINEMQASGNLGCDKTENPDTIIVDYGGANVAKPLHVGHLRPAVIGESVKRIARFMGHNVIGDVHLGDWGLQMGLVIVEVKERHPELPYFDADYTGEYPEEPPFTISELEEIYPTASGKSKVDEAFKERAQTATYEMQSGRRGYRALWKHIMDVSLPDLKMNYDNLNVEFDLWKGESDAQPYMDDMVQDMVDKGVAFESQGALVVDIREEGDSKELPPCIVRKSDGASLYATSDLATLVEREKLYHPDRYIYVVDKRQELYFTQVFRTAKKAGIVKPDAQMTFLGFGTMNGKDGKPFKTRDGGVMKLESLISNIEDAVYEKMSGNREMPEDEARKVARIVGLSALKYGDLSNQASKDYVFDLERFISFEGNTGPYNLYTIVRINSILKKYAQMGIQYDGDTSILPASNDSVKALMLELTKLNEVMHASFEEYAPHKICQYIYDLSNVFNKFYHETKIIAEEDLRQQASYISLLKLTRDVLTTCVDLLGIEVPDRM